jgi:hypothetical protein
MPPRKKTPAKAVRPAKVKELCPDESHGDAPIHPDATHFACEHGSWELVPAEVAEQGDDEFLDDLQDADE